VSGPSRNSDRREPFSARPAPTVVDKLKLLLLGVALLAALAYFLAPRAGQLTGAEARKLVAAGAVLVDVRTAGEFAAGHIEGAVNVPVQELDARSNELPRDRALVVYCRSGNRSGTAARALKSAGFTDIHDLGAMSRW
jgi:phage shock protein E